MGASGFAGLGYQIVWTQQCALWLGHESAAVLAVVTAFFGGLAAGALVLGSRIDRSARPERWYAACEAAIAVWTVVLALLLAPISEWMLTLTGNQPSPLWQWTVAFVGTFLVLLPATAAMGATLPAMERVVSGADPSTSRIAALYACNTFGAVVGVLAVAFWLVPQLGLARTAGVCAVLNLVCAVVVLGLPSKSPDPVPMPAAVPDRYVLLVLAITGLLGIGFEVLVVRVLSQVAEDTVYTFALLLAVYLVGTASGAALYERIFRRTAWVGNHTGRLRDALLGFQAVACLLGMATLWGAEQVKQAVVDALGSGMATALAAEATLAVAAFGLPTVVMGALFSHLITQARTANNTFGSAIGANTLGAAAAPILFGVILVPAFGAKAALLLVAGGYVLLALTLSGFRRSPVLGVPACAALALAVWAPPLAFVDVPEGGQVVSYREGTIAAVSVVEDAEGVATLRINNRQQEGSSATLLADARQALLPLLLHPAPDRALFLGLGTGVTASSAVKGSMLEVDAVELLPDVIAASAHFTRAAAGADAADARSPRLRLISGDARRFVRTTAQTYDVIVADNFHPARSGSGTLYTVEHFTAVRARLTQQGVFCQWLPLHQLDLDTLRSIVRSFVAVYPGGWAMLATNSLETPVLGLVGRGDGKRFARSEVRERVGSAALPQQLAMYGLVDEFALLGGFVAGSEALTRFAGAAPINTDDRPVVAYSAPRITYAPDSAPRDRLAALLREITITPAELIAPGADLAWSSRLAAYWKARDRFIEIGRTVQPMSDPRRMLDQVRAPLLSVLQISRDFRPAYDPLVRMATALGRSDPLAAEALLTELQKFQPPTPDERLATPPDRATPR